MKTYTFDKSAALFERAQKSIAGGVNSGIRKLEKPVPLFFKDGKGSRLTDVDGNEYIDYQIGQGALLLGHSHPGVAKALADQAHLGTHWAAQAELEITVAEHLQRTVPVCERLRFNNSATEVLIAVTRLVRNYTGRNKLLRFEGHYHGWNDEGLWGYAPAPDTWGNPSKPVHPSGGILQVLGDYQLLAQYNNLESVESLLKQHGKDVAAILLEPIMCNTGCIVPEPGFLEGLRKLADEYGVVLVFDETITGFRFGMTGAEGWSKVRPDLCVFGKAIAGGVPFAALGGKEKFMQPITEGKVVHAGTLNANPLCLAAAAAALKALEEDKGYEDRIKKLGLKLMDGLNREAKDQGIPFLAYGAGTAFQVSMGNEPAPKNYREHTQRGDKALFGKLREELLKRGVRAIERGLWFISCAHTDKDIDDTLNRAADALKAIK